MDSLKVVMQGRDVKRINRVRSFAQQNLLKPKNLTVGMAEADAVTLAQFTAPQVTTWQSAGKVALAYGQPPSGDLPAPLRIWSLPDSLVNLAEPQRAIVPRMALKVGSYDQASGQMVRQPVSYYSWAMKVGLQIKRLPSTAGSPSSLWTYELTGVNEYDIVLLERLLARISPSNDSSVADLTLLYIPSPTGDAREGLQSDGNENVAFFLTQVNLSTDTHPNMVGEANLRRSPQEGPPTGCYNTPYEFVRMLWEGSITRSGGYYLYYYSFQTQQGFPDRIFDDRGQANLELLITFQPTGEADRDRAQPYMNCVVTGDINVTPQSGTEQSDPAGTFSLYAETDPEQISVSLAGRSLSDLAQAYYSDPILIGEQNATLPLSPGKALTLANGLYQVGPNAPGGDLNAIARAFQTTPEAIKATNPKISNWEKLDLYQTIRLPVLQVTTQPGDQLQSLAKTYGQQISALVADNQTVAGLFPDQPALQVTTGPSLRSALVPPGVAQLMAKRDQPAPTPQNPDDPNFASDYLESMFHMLGYQVAANQDFRASITGLPIGPSDPVPEDGLGDKSRLPEDDPTQPWSYSRSVPYFTFAEPKAGDSPYQGIGDLLQLNLSWQDIFGNQILTPLDLPTPDSPLNRPPMLLGYTDALRGPNQWPNVAYTYQVLPGPTAGMAILQINLEFNPAPYEGTDNGEEKPAWQQAAQADLINYRTIRHQLGQVLNDQPAVAFNWQSSLLPGDPRPLSTENVSRLKGWIDEIYTYLDQRAQRLPGTAPSIDPLTESIAMADLNPDQVFALTAALIFRRPVAYVDGDFRTSPPVWEAVTPLPPLRENDQQASARSLKRFATDLETALQKPGQFQLKLATGPDRAHLSQAATESPVWVVRLGRAADQAIRYSLLNPGKPMVYAPTPLANTLQNRDGVPIWDYKPESGHPIDFEADPDRRLDLGNIDLDLWGRQFLATVDQVLSPEYTSAIAILTKRTGIDYIRNLLTQKKSLAAAVENLVMHVFAADSPSDAQTRAAREAFRQQLLIQLSNAYTTDAVIQFQAAVDGSVDTGPGQTPGQLYGPLIAPAGQKLPDTVAVTAPRLPLAKATADDPALLNVLLTSRGNKQDPTQTAVQPFVTLTAAYQPTYVEHQIGALPGIQDYQASSWLTFVLPPDPDQPANWPLYGDLGTFDVPLVLRAYPTPPSMVMQGQEEPATTQCTAVTDPLARALLWNFGFTYSQFYHYPQDRTYFKVLFNIQPTMQGKRLTRDLFIDLAEYVTVFPAVQQDLEQYLRPIDSQTSDPTLSQRADLSLRSLTAMVERVAESWHGWQADRMLLQGGAAEGLSAYTFYIAEQADEDGNLLVSLVDTGDRPAGVGTPMVQIEGYTTRVVESPGKIQYTFADGNGPLSAQQGLAIAGRKVLLPCLNVVVMQDAWASAYTTRNEELVPGRRSADPFIYQTPEVKFTNPFMPRVSKTDRIDIAAVGRSHPVVDSLARQLANFFTTLFSGDVPPQQQIQLECRYGYALPNNLQVITLPVLMLPPTPVDVNTAFQVPEGWTPGGYDPNGSFVCNLTSAIWQWFSETVPTDVGGELQIDLTVMSSLTVNLVPLLRLEGLHLGLQNLNSKPPVVAH